MVGRPTFIYDIAEINLPKINNVATSPHFRRSSRRSPRKPSVRLTMTNAIWLFSFVTIPFVYLTDGYAS